jgi:hypothetical protein
MPSPILAPVVALVLWTFVMWSWLYATRIPAIRKARVELDPAQTNADLARRLPPQVRWKADNYNHLLEQPTLFYAIALTLAWLGHGHGLMAALAWAYVGIRIVHSLVQALVNLVILRWALFMLSSLVLLAMTIRAAVAAFALDALF